MHALGVGMGYPLPPPLIDKREKIRGIHFLLGFHCIINYPVQPFAEVLGATIAHECSHVGAPACEVRGTSSGYQLYVLGCGLETFQRSGWYSPLGSGSYHNQDRRSQLGS